MSTPRGLAIKVLGVEGPRLAGSDAATTQDLVMVNGPAFAAPSARAFLRNLELLAGPTDKAPGANQALSAVRQLTEKAIEALGGKSATLLSLGGPPRPTSSARPATARRHCASTRTSPSCRWRRSRRR